MHDMCAAALAGDFAEAVRIDKTLRPLHKALFMETSPIPVKWAVAQLSLMQPGIRLPMVGLSASLHPVLRDAMRHAGVL
jgi:4-hydroxy-tetrahydrodipicolinate synthase